VSAVTAVSLLRLDPEIAAEIPAERRDLATRAALARTIEVQPGHWEAAEESQGAGGFGLLVVSGIFCRRVVQGQRYGAELLGPGDLLRPWDRIGGWSSIPSDADWLVIEAAKLAVLDADFTRRCAPFPQVAVSMIRRGLLRSRYLAILIAIISQRRVETRLTMLFWHLADRFGRVRGEGVDVPIPLTHRILAELVAARRPSVSTAVSSLQEQGVLQRTDEGWRLRGPGPTGLGNLADKAEAAEELSAADLNS
jgi:CRP-like cAMP-binding protein